MNIDKTVLKETRYIASWVLIFSIVLQAVFLIISKWDYTVLLGNLLGAAIAVLNFFLMGITVQKAVEKMPEEAKTTVKVSQIYRNLFILVMAATGTLLPYFNSWTVLIPLLFPRIAIALKPLCDKNN